MAVSNCRPFTTSIYCRLSVTVRKKRTVRGSENKLISWALWGVTPASTSWVIEQYALFHHARVNEATAYLLVVPFTLADILAFLSQALIDLFHGSLT